LTREVKDFFGTYNKKLLMEFKDNPQKWKGIQICGLEELILLKCSYFPTDSQTNALIYGIYKNPNVIVHKNRKKSLKFICNTKDPNSQINIEKEQNWRHRTS
jgi:hypothetical protein